MAIVYWTPQTSPSSGGIGLADGPVLVHSLSLATTQLPASSSSSTRCGEPGGPSEGAATAPRRTVILAIPEAHLRSPLLSPTVAWVSAVSSSALIGTITAATVHASLAGLGFDCAAVPSHAARTRQATVTDVRKTNPAAQRDISIGCFNVHEVQGSPGGCRVPLYGGED